LTLILGWEFDVDVLILSVHPDDEALGCGGTILKHAAAGDRVFWLIMTEAYEPQWSSDLIARKTAEVEDVAKAYGVDEFFKLKFPTTQLDVVPQSEMISGIRDVIGKVRPELVYMIHRGDIHTDHYATFLAAMSVLKPFYMAQLGVRRVLCYETLSSTEAAPAFVERAFVPNVFSDITPYLDRKIEIMDLYGSETHSDPFPRGPSAIRALARFRGATISVDYAESFILVREIF